MKKVKTIKEKEKHKKEKKKTKVRVLEETTTNNSLDDDYD